MFGTVHTVKSRMCLSIHLSTDALRWAHEIQCDDEIYHLVDATDRYRHSIALSSQSKIHEICCAVCRSRAQFHENVFFSFLFRLLFNALSRSQCVFSTHTHTHRAEALIMPTAYTLFSPVVRLQNYIFQIILFDCLSFDGYVWLNVATWQSGKWLDFRRLTVCTVHCSIAFIFSFSIPFNYLLLLFHAIAVCV